MNGNMTLIFPLAAFAAFDLATAGVIHAKGPDHEIHPLHTVYLRLRPEAPHGFGRVLTWKRFDHPSRR
jgi:hypothetical protein